MQVETEMTVPKRRDYERGNLHKEAKIHMVIGEF